MKEKKKETIFCIAVAILVTVLYTIAGAMQRGWVDLPGFRRAVGPHRAAHLILDQAQDQITRRISWSGMQNCLKGKQISSLKH